MFRKQQCTFKEGVFNQNIIFLVFLVSNKISSSAAKKQTALAFSFATSRSVLTKAKNDPRFITHRHFHELRVNVINILSVEIGNKTQSIKSNDTTNHILHAYKTSNYDSYFKLWG